MLHKWLLKSLIICKERLSSFNDNTLYFGGNSSQTLGGNSIGAGIVFDYYLSDAQQLRIENYLRWYYGRNF